MTGPRSGENPRHGLPPEKTRRYGQSTPGLRFQFKIRTPGVAEEAAVRAAQARAIKELLEWVDGQARGAKGSGVSASGRGHAARPGRSAT